MNRRRHRARSNAIGEFSDPALIAKVAEYLEAAGVEAVEIEVPGERKLRIVVREGGEPAETGLSPAAASDPVSSSSRKVVVKAPLAGHFVDAHPARNAVLAGEGAALKAGQLAGFVQVGPILVPIHASVAGTVADVSAQAGTLLGYGDAVLLLEPDQ